MPELRKDPIVGRWVIIAHERAKRPHDFKGEAQTQVEAGLCPFCEGQKTRRRPRSSPIASAARGRTARAGGSASCPTSSPPSRSRGTSTSAATASTT